MEPSPRVRYFVRNHSNQPLELHLPGALLVVSPYQEAEIREPDLECAQLKVFRKQRLVSVREQEDPGEMSPAEAAGAGNDAETPVTGKPAGGKRRGTGKKEG